jgi:hypothetical protein
VQHIFDGKEIGNHACVFQIAGDLESPGFKVIPGKSPAA